MASFAEFKKKQEELNSAVKKMAEKPTRSYQDDRVWQFTKDGSGNANATIRFLPQQDPSKSPVILTYRHAFQETGRWFIDECPVTVGEKCPVCEQSAGLWSSDEDTARKYWRNKVYISNILVVDDEANAENNGKVFIWKFGKKVYDKIMDVVQPEDEDEDPINVFDFDEGVNFKLKITQVSGFNNYDKSKFMTKQSAIEDQEEVFDCLYDLNEFQDKERFKTYDELLEKFSNVTGANTPVQEKQSKPQQQEEKHQSFEFKEEEEKNENDDADEEEIDFDKLLEDDDDDDGKDKKESEFDPDDEIPF